MEEALNLKWLNYAHENSEKDVSGRSKMPLHLVYCLEFKLHLSLRFFHLNVSNPPNAP